MLIRRLLDLLRETPALPAPDRGTVMHAWGRGRPWLPSRIVR